MTRAALVSILAVSALGCGARTPLEVGTSDGGIAPGADASTPSCGVAQTPAPCSAWQVAGAEQVVSLMPRVGEGMGLGDVIATNDCGVLAAWYTSANDSSLAWSTRAFGFDGSPRDGIKAHPGLVGYPNASGSISLATNGARVAAIASDVTGCLLAVLDANGTNVDAVVKQSDAACLGLAAESDGFSYLESSNGGTPVSLVRVDAKGAQRGATSLPVATNRALWSRYVFDDGTFLLNTFREDPMTGVYTDWLQHFDARGKALAPEAVVGANTAPVWIAATSQGALGAWDWSAANLVPLSRDGAPTGPIQMQPLSGPPYGITIAPVPNGDAMLLSLVLGDASRFDLSVQAIAPDGTARGPATHVRTSEEQSRVYAVVAASGDRALLVFEDGGVRTLPLTCVR